MADVKKVINNPKKYKRSQVPDIVLMKKARLSGENNGPSERYISKNRMHLTRVGFEKTTSVLTGL